ncbi:phosphate-starvation-inducible PsiE family protein [Myxococcus sp. AB036A]|uniref:phosphate-starvation-inducible PsiE family protein n=1 Tax=Myxococcus sp. AB036A TaxID=2562793 RepID=UPI001146D819|nr:phosphate-starvation-inducible PsiE family protein [Myxococcus sp. AB036A]
MGARSTVERWLERIEASLSLGVTIGTAFVAVLGLAAFLMAIVHRGLLGGTLDATAIGHLLDVGLVVFIALELFKIGIAHLRNRSIVPTVMEAALIAVVRKIVVMELDAETFPRVLALSLLLLSVGATWFLVHRSHASVGPASNRE